MVFHFQIIFILLFSICLPDLLFPVWYLLCLWPALCLYGLHIQSPDCHSSSDEAASLPYFRFFSGSDTSCCQQNCSCFLLRNRFFFTDISCTEIGLQSAQHSKKHSRNLLKIYRRCHNNNGHILQCNERTSCHSSLTAHSLHGQNTICSLYTGGYLPCRH